MAEIEIKRVNFFDGQFLRQDEFIAFDVYHRHMRRRWAYVMFDKSGVVQVGNDDLMLVAPAPGTLPAEKKVQVKRGMAIAKSDDIMEGKEIVLQSDTVVDLTDPVLGLSGADTAVFTVHYAELPMDQSTDGDEPGDTRIKERAVITVHKNDLAGAPALPNGDSYVRLGGIKFNDLSTAGPREVALLNTKLFAAAPVVPQILLTPNSSKADTTKLVHVTASGGIDLSGAVSVTISAGANITHTVSNQTPTSLDLTLTLAANATTADITISVGTLSATATFTVQVGMNLIDFTGVDQTVAAPDPRKDHLIINGTGLTAGEPATIVFAGTAVQSQRTVVVPDSILGGNVTSTQILIPIALIPDAAAAGTATVSHDGDIKNLSVTPPVAIKAGGLPLTVRQDESLTVEGVRFVAPIQIRLINSGGDVVNKQTSTGFPAADEALAPNLVLMIPGNATPGDCELRVTTPGGTIVGSHSVEITV